MTLQLQTKAVYAGASPYAAGPVIVVHLDLAAADAETWSAVEAGVRALHGAFPDWLPAAPPSGPLGLGHAVVKWALAALNEVRGFLHDAGAEATPRGSGCGSAIAIRASA